MEAIVRAFRQEKWSARLCAVISNRADAAGLVFAAEAGIPTQVVSHKDYADREAYDAALQAVIDTYEPDLVILAGFMRILTTGFVEHYTGAYDQYPSLAVAQFPRVAYPPAGDRGGCQGAWRDRAFRHAGT